jgi:hypothetical protein
LLALGIYHAVPVLERSAIARLSSAQSWLRIHHGPLGLAIIGLGGLLLVGWLLVLVARRWRGRDAGEPDEWINGVGFFCLLLGTALAKAPDVVWRVHLPRPVAPGFAVTAGILLAAAFGALAALSARLVHAADPTGPDWQSSRRMASVVFVTCLAPVPALLVGLAYLPGHPPDVARRVVEFPFAAAGTAGIVLISFSRARLGTWALLALSDRLPWRVGRFLRYAADRGILVREGPGFRFRHPLLREYLAGRCPPARPVGQGRLEP